MKDFIVVQISKYDEEQSMFFEEDIRKPVKVIQAGCRKEAFAIWKDSLSLRMKKKMTFDNRLCSGKIVNHPVENNMIRFIVKQTK